MTDREPQVPPEIGALIDAYGGAQVRFGQAKGGTDYEMEMNRVSVDARIALDKAIAALVPPETSAEKRVRFHNEGDSPSAHPDALAALERLDGFMESVQWDFTDEGRDRRLADIALIRKVLSGQKEEAR